MTFLDGVEIDRCIEYDSDTGIAVVWEPEDGPYGSGPMILREKYHPRGMCVFDGLARPTEEDMQKIREKHTGKGKKYLITCCRCRCRCRYHYCYHYLPPLFHHHLHNTRLPILL
jgi:hypothetical protein